MAVITRNERERQNLDTDLPGADSKTWRPEELCRIYPVPVPTLAGRAGNGAPGAHHLPGGLGPGHGLPHHRFHFPDPAEGTNVEVAKSVRDVTGSNIDEAVRWLQREGAWLFDGLNEAVVFVLIKIEQGLGWIPWPVLVVGIGILRLCCGPLAADVVHSGGPAVHGLYGPVGKRDRDHRPDGRGGCRFGGHRVPLGRSGGP